MFFWKTRELTYLMALLVAVATVCLPNVSSASPAETSKSVAKDTPQTKKWNGTASATCVCKDGKCVPLSCTVVGAFSQSEAKRQLKQKIEFQASLEGGKVSGSIQYSISWTL